jgi:hypothetical protein
MRSEREQRALDALIVSQLRACDETHVEHLPELTDDERASLDSLGVDFVDRLLAGRIEMPAELPREESDLAMAGEAFGMNRAEQIDEETQAELDQKRREIIERLKREEDNGKSDP